MKEALKDGGIDPGEVGYVNGHGTSTPYNDLFETKAIKTVFGDHAYKMVVNSTKSMTGHLLGGGGGMELIITALSLRDGKVHPTIGLEHPDPDCDLNYVPDGAVERDLKYAITNSLGFGGHNATLLLKKYED